MRLSKHTHSRMGQRAPSRKRFTRAIAVVQPDEKLLDIFQGSQGFIRADQKTPGSVPLGLLARQKKVNAICYNELLTRGYEREALDYDPERHIAEVNADDTISQIQAAV